MKTLLYILLILYAILLSIPAYADRDCDHDLMTISCIRAYKDDLDKAHLDKINAIATIISQRRAMGTDPKQIRLYGYGVKFKKSDPYIELSQKRAEAVAKALQSALQSLGIDPGDYVFDIRGLGDQHSIATNSTRLGRAINRRVEITFSTQKLGHESVFRDINDLSEYSPCNTRIPYPDSVWLTNKQLNKIRQGKTAVALNRLHKTLGLILNDVLANWSCTELRVNLLHAKTAADDYNADSVTEQVTLDAYHEFQSRFLRRNKAGDTLDSETLKAMDAFLGLPVKAGNDAFVNITTPGIFNDPKVVLAYFRDHYDRREHQTRSFNYLSHFKGDNRMNQERLKKQFRVVYNGNFARLKDPKKRLTAVKKSLNTIIGMPCRDKLALAPSFVMGFRESGRHLLQNKTMHDSWSESGLDFLYKLQGRIRSECLLPSSLRFDKGSQYGEISPETGVRKQSAKIKARDIYLAHSAYFNHAYLHFVDMAKKTGFSDTDIDKLNKLSTSFWLAQSFARPGGCAWDDPVCKTYGIKRLLSYLHTKHKDLNSIVEVTKISHFKRKKTVNIAVRTAGVIAALDDMMHKFAHERALMIQRAYLKTLNSRYPIP